MRGCSNKQPKAISTNAGLLAPIVSSISSKDGFSPKPHGLGLFFAPGLVAMHPASPLPAPQRLLKKQAPTTPTMMCAPPALLGG